MVCVTFFYINSQISLLPNIFQIKTAEMHSEPWWTFLKKCLTVLRNTSSGCFGISLS